MTRLKGALFSFAFPAVVGAVIFFAAGRWDLPFVWWVLAVLAGFYLALALFADAGLLGERLAPAGTNLDRLTQPLGVVFLLTHWILAGLDVGRYQWSLVPWEIQAAGLFGYVVSLTLAFWAMRTNPFYSSVVRVQTERGHHPVATGPYRIVRHPGYAATILAMVSGGGALGSWVAMIPIAAFIGIFIRRTLLEDRMLVRDLDGYAEYARQVRYRLLAGVF